MNKILIITLLFFCNLSSANAAEALKITRQNASTLNAIANSANNRLAAKCPISLIQAGTAEARAQLDKNGCKYNENDFNPELAKGSLIDKLSVTAYKNQVKEIEIQEGQLAFVSDIQCYCDDGGYIDQVVNQMTQICNTFGCGNRNTKFDPAVLRASLEAGAKIAGILTTNNGMTAYNGIDPKLRAGTWSLMSFGNGVVPRGVTIPNPSQVFGSMPSGGLNLCLESKSYCRLEYDLYNW